jgi:hypothetical protein
MMQSTTQLVFSIYYSFVFSALWLFAEVIIVREKKFVNSVGSKDTVTFWSVGVENRRETPQNSETASSKLIFELIEKSFDLSDYRLEIGGDDLKSSLRTSSAGIDS